MRNADRILVFDRGRLIEQGSHAELLKKDGTYARLVRIQTQVSKDPNVDKLIHHEESDDERAAVDVVEAEIEKGTESEKIPDIDSGKEDEPENSPQEINWLDPSTAGFSMEHGQLTLEARKDKHPVFLIRTFPASHPNEYLSIRRWNKEGEDIELGMIRKIDEWPETTREDLNLALNRRYLLRPVHRIHAARLKLGFLEFDIESTDGPTSFTMRWTSGKATEFGERGKLLVDTEGNRFVVEDVDALPDEDRERFLQYIYW
ncbi:MAG: DUF1854 domain-containing protein [Verrucomicrobiota bacterium]